MSSVSFSDASAREEPPRRRVQRTLSTVERDALQSVLDVVERETDSEHTKGMSRFTFFLGLANLILSAFLLGACTESFWLVYALQALFIIGLRIRHSWSISKNTPTQPGMMLYYLDLCWVANFMLAFSFMAVLVEVLEERFLGSRRVGALNARAVSQAPTAGLIASLIATGPLGWSVFVLPCKMVLHDIANYANTWIHLWPVFTTLSLRWAPDRLAAAYPGRRSPVWKSKFYGAFALNRRVDLHAIDALVDFHTDFDALVAAELHGEGMGFGALMALASATYFAWWIPFTLWMLAHGRFQSPERTGRDTIYLRLMLTDSVAGANCGVRTPPRGTKLGSTPAEALDDAASVSATMKYMVFHALACHLSFVSSALCMTYIYVHLFFALAGLVFSLYLGSAWYDRMLTSHVTKKVRKHIAASTAKKD